ncbi:hypothetical protein Gasu2_65850 [Galdieria sulphuraria]|nr:hypothetical protein Gasu2_65850 [Galdieria sulphuraria]
MREMKRQPLQDKTQLVNTPSSKTIVEKSPLGNKQVSSTENVLEVDETTKAPGVYSALPWISFFKRILRQEESFNQQSPVVNRTEKRLLDPRSPSVDRTPLNEYLKKYKR